VTSTSDHAQFDQRIALSPGKTKRVAVQLFARIDLESGRANFVQKTLWQRQTHGDLVAIAATEAGHQYDARMQAE
jgi:hypothetical protein